LPNSDRLLAVVVREVVVVFLILPVEAGSILFSLSALIDYSVHVEVFVCVYAVLQFFDDLVFLFDFSQ
jgi:hypothetical protein